MANTLAAALAPDHVDDAVIASLEHRLAPLGSFALMTQTAPGAPRRSIEVPKVTATSTTVKNPSNFEAGDHTQTATKVNVDHYIQPWHITAQEYQQGYNLEVAAKRHAHALADELWGIVTTLLQVGTFTNTAKVVAQASFDADDSADLWGTIAKVQRKTLVLDGVAYAQFLPTDANSLGLGAGAYGYEGGVHLATLWTGASATTYGFAGGDDAFAIATGLPAYPESVKQAMTDQKVLTLESLGIQILRTNWVSLATRAEWTTFEICFGAAVADIGSLTMIRSAGT